MSQNSVEDNISFLGTLNGFLRVLSAQMGEHPFNYAYGAYLCELDENNLIDSYKDFYFGLMNKPETVDGCDGDGSDFEDIDDEYNFPEPLEEDYNFSEPVKEDDYVAWLGDLLREKFLGRIKHGRYLAWSIMNFIMFIKEDSPPSHLYHCCTSNKEFTGLLVFIPCVDQYLVLFLYKSREQYSAEPETDDA